MPVSEISSRIRLSSTTRTTTVFGMKRAAVVSLILSALVSWGACGCNPSLSAGKVGSGPPPPAEPAPASSPENDTLPDYLARMERHGELGARDADAILSAPPGDIAVLRSYPRRKEKGALTGAAGERLTILTAKTVYAAGEEVRVIHVHEATKAGVKLYVMGPKAIFGEYIDGKLASKAEAAPPGLYDGAVKDSPYADDNYEVSVHRLGAGTHRLQWRFATLSGPTVLASNILTIEVR